MQTEIYLTFFVFFFVVSCLACLFVSLILFLFCFLSIFEYLVLLFSFCRVLLKCKTEIHFVAFFFSFFLAVLSELGCNET